MDFFIPFDSIGDDRAHPAAGLAEMIKTVMTNGVHPNPGNSFFVTAIGGWEVSLAPGKCLIEGRIGANHEAKTLTTPVPHGVLDRIDRVVLRLDHSMRMIYEYVKAGEPSQQPRAPDLQRDADAYEISIADIAVGAKAISITQGAITDTRQNTALCGIINSLITVDPDTLFAQYDAIWAEWIAQYKALTVSQYDQYRAEMDDTYAVFYDMVTDLTQRAQDEHDTYRDEIAQLTDMSAQHYEDYREELDTFRAGAFNGFGTWYGAFRLDTETQVSNWFATYISTLGPDEAVQLFNAIYAHEQRQVASETGVHGMRYHDKKLQVSVDGGWLTVIGVDEGYRWAYIDALDRTWQEWDTLNYTWADFEELIGTE